MALILMNTRVRWHDRCVSPGIQIVANGPSIFKYKTAVGITFITSVEHILGIRVIFASVAPTENELDTNDFDPFPSSHSPQATIVKKKVSCAKLCHFLSHFCFYIQKTIKESGILSKKKAISFCFCLFRAWMALVIMQAGNIFATLRNKWPTKAILYCKKINMEEFLILEFLIRRLFYSGLLDIKWI